MENPDRMVPRNIKADLHYQAAVVRGEEGGEPSHQAILAIIFDAMRRAYLMGRDDANADAEPLGAPVDPRFIPTRGDLIALREDAAALRGAGLPATVNVAPRVLYLAWPNGQFDPTNPDSTRWRCVSFNLPE